MIFLYKDISENVPKFEKGLRRKGVKFLPKFSQTVAEQP